MKSLEIKNNIFWVGAIDWNVRDFHGYSTYKGTTYNAYLVKDEKIALFDTVKKSHMQDLVHHIKQLVDPSKIDYLIVNHVEMDHSGALPEMVELIKPEKIFCSRMGLKAINEHFHPKDWPLEAVENGQTISLGSKTVHFLETRMLHWPDSMFSYLQEDKVLISSDAFGQHYATSERFDDEVDFSQLMEQTAKYYANILTLYSPLIRKLLAKVQEMGLEIDMIAPDHGVIWRSHIKDVIQAYADWSQNKGQRKALVIYDTMWQSTEMMAKAITTGINMTGVSVKLINLAVTHRSDVMTDVLNAKAVVLGCATLNNGMLPRMAGFLMYMRGLKPTNKIGAAFGSFGWSGEAVKLMNAAMEEMKFDIVEPGLRFKYVPSHTDLQECVEMGKRIGQAVITQTEE
ncbi:MAG: flavodoxin domain-containing protein [Deltaproteobacteria bacterium]|jgi:flavorubredoxin|nr:flavodoxin domain-containing protein [Deltaproteobacteria bacterium]